MLIYHVNGLAGRILEEIHHCLEIAWMPAIGVRKQLIEARGVAEHAMVGQRSRKWRDPRGQQVEDCVFVQVPRIWMPLLPRHGACLTQGGEVAGH